MADWVPIEDQDDPRLYTEFDPVDYSNEKKNPPATPEPVWNPASYSEGDSAQPKPKALPTRTPNLSTFYYPSTPDDQVAHGLDPKVEGGITGAGKFSSLDIRNHTLEQFLDGKSDFVAVAMKGSPTGELFQTSVKGQPVTAKWVDTGALKDGQIDFATSTPELAKTGIDRPFNATHYAEGKPQPVPDVHAFLEPAPTDTPEAEQPAQESDTDRFGKALGRGVKGAAEAIGRLGTPREIKVSPFSRPKFEIPQTAAPQQQFVGTPSGPMIPTPQQLPSAMPQPLPAPPGGQELGYAGKYLEGALQETEEGMRPSVESIEEVMRHPLSAKSMEQYAKSANAAMMFPEGFTHGAVRKTINPILSTTGKISEAQLPSAREVPVPESMQPKGATVSEAPPLLPSRLEKAYQEFQKLSDETDQWFQNNPAPPPGGRAPSILEGGRTLEVQKASNERWQSHEGWVAAAKRVTDNLERLNQELLPYFKNYTRGKYARSVRDAYQIALKRAQKKTGVSPPAAATPPSQQPPPPTPPTPPQGPPPVQPPLAGGVPPQPPKTPVQGLTLRKIVKGITQKIDSVFTRADYDARQAVNPLRQEFDQDVMGSPKSVKNIEAAKDLEAATFIAEAGGNKVALKHDLELVRNSKNKKLAKKYEPILKFAVDNFTRISDKLSKSRYGKLMTDQLAEDAAAGITYGEREGYVTHVFKNEPENTLMSFMTGGGTGAGGFSKYFTRNRQFNSLSEAINAGVEPHSVNLADLAQHRISASRKLIIQKSIFNELNATMLPDGQPVVKPIGHYQDANGQFHMNVPSGYDLIRANGIDLAVHPEVAGVFKALYGDSALRRTKAGRAVMKTVGVEKAYTLAVDTFHGFRGIMKNLFYGGKNSRLGYEKGLTVYELSNEALDTSVQRGEITQKQADWAKKSRPNIEAMMKHGLNVSRFSDNLVGQMHVTFPGARGINDWIFKRVFRGAMMQAADANFQRNLSRFPELTKEQVAQRTVTEMNEVFGNLGSQGLFRDKTTRDLLNLTFLAPQWVESQARAEFRGYGQAAKIIPDALQGKFRVGTVAQGQATAVAAYLIGNQIINYATTGHSTFENEGIHKLDAFLPFGDRGVWLDPLALSAEYVDQFIRVMDRQGDKATIPSVVAEIGSHKLSGIGRAAVTVATQHDWRGRRLESTWDVAKEAGTNLLPVPIFSKGITSGFELDPNSPVGFSYTPKWDEIAQQLFMSMGQKALLGPSTGQYPGGPLRVPEGEGGDIERPKRGSKQQGGVI